MPATTHPVLTLLLAVAALLVGGTAVASATVTVRPDARSLATEDVDSEGSIPTVVADGDDGPDRIVVRQEPTGLLVAPAPGSTTRVRVDPVAAEAPDASCVVEGTGVRCAPAEDQELEVALGGGDDAVALQDVTVPATLDGGPGADRLTGGPGNDELIGGPGIDVLDGGPGRDTASYVDETASVRVDAQAGTARTREGDERLTAVEGAIGGSGADVLQAAGAGGLLVGGPGGDLLEGGGGDDQIVAVDPRRTGAAGGGPGDGADTVRAGGGDDTITAASSDVVSAGAGDDVLDVGPVDDRFAVATSLQCGPGVDRVPLHDARLVLAPDCERFAEARQDISTLGDFVGTLRFTRTSARALRVSSGRACRVLQVRLRTQTGRVTALRSLRGSARVGFGVPRGVSSLEALGCGSKRWTLQARVRR